MGKPFNNELDIIEETMISSNNLDIKSLISFVNKINTPIYIVGSGGSLSACFFLVELFQSIGKFAKAVTPLELFYSKETLSSSSVIFISASGRNTDIKFALRKAVEAEAKSIGVICLKINSLLSVIGRKYNIVNVFEYEPISSKDGFLATNSLIAFFVIFYRVIKNKKINTPNILNKFNSDVTLFLDKTNSECTYTILYSGWGKPIAIDLESKCSEAGLAPILLSDYRNFGHGRHNWFDKRKNSAIIAISNSQDKDLCNKTLDALPKDIPKLIIYSIDFGADSSLELLIKSFHIINLLGIKQRIDPGKPGVPDYGSKLYHLSYTTLFSEENYIKLSTRCKLAIRRKTKVSSINVLDKKEIQMWTDSYGKFIGNINKTEFGCVLFDYDGTICSQSERFSGPSKVIINKIIEIIFNGFPVGIITGRGKSVRIIMQKHIPKKYWNMIIIGYYNGSDVGTLDDNTLPNVNKQMNNSLQKVDEVILNLVNLYKLEYQKRPTQITIEIENLKKWSFVRNLIIQKIKTNEISDVQLLESSHSMDIIPDTTSKLNILKLCNKKICELKLAREILRIGDKGQWSGNDFMLLNSKHGLSVDEVSSEFDTCWNIASLGNRNTAATLEYLNCITFTNTAIRLKINK